MWARESPGISSRGSFGSGVGVGGFGGHHGGHGGHQPLILGPSPWRVVQLHADGQEVPLRGDELSLYSECKMPVAEEAWAPQRRGNRGTTALPVSGGKVARVLLNAATACIIVRQHPSHMGSDWICLLVWCFTGLKVVTVEASGP